MKQPQPKGFLQSAWDAIGIPARLVLFPPEWLERCGWTTLEDERMRLQRALGRSIDELSDATDRERWSSTVLFDGVRVHPLVNYARDRHVFSFVMERGRNPGVSYSVSF